MNGHLSVINGYQKIHDSVTHLNHVSATDRRLFDVSKSSDNSNRAVKNPDSK